MPSAGFIPKSSQKLNTETLKHHDYAGKVPSNSSNLCRYMFVKFEQRKQYRHDSCPFPDETYQLVPDDMCTKVVTKKFSALSLELERKHGKLYTGVCRQVGQSLTFIIFCN